MTKKNKIVLILFGLLFFAIFLTCNKSYAASASISASSTSAYVGETVKITAKVNAGSWNLHLSGGGQSSPLVGETKIPSNSSDSTSINFSTDKPGTYTFKLTGDITEYEPEVNSPIDKEIKITIKEGSSTPSSQKDDGDDESKITSEGSKSETNKSRNNYLSSLKVSDGTLSPEFNRDITSYTINFDDENTIKNLDKIKITATADDKTAKVTGTGEKALVEGENTFKINVKSESGSTRTYVIKVTKPATIKESDLRLSSLKVQTVDNEGNSADAEIDKAFDKETLEYSMNVESNISGLNVTAIPATTDIDVSISGNENLHEGMNEVIITLTSKDDNTIQTTYKIVVNKAQSELLINASDNESLQNDNFARKNRKFIFTIGILTIILIALLIIWYKKSKKRLNNNEKIEKNLNHNLIDDDDVIIDKDNEEYNEIKQKNVDDANVKNDTKEFDEKFNVSTKPKRKGGKHF